MRSRPARSVAGRVEKIVYQPGKFINADLDKASVDNERNSLVISTAGVRVDCYVLALVPHFRLTSHLAWYDLTIALLGSKPKLKPWSEIRSVEDVGKSEYRNTAPG